MPLHVKARLDWASMSAVSLASKYQVGPRAIPNVIAGDAAATGCVWDKYKSM